MVSCNDYNSYEGVTMTDDAGTMVTVQKNLVSTVWISSIDEPEQVQQITDAAGTFSDRLDIRGKSRLCA